MNPEALYVVGQRRDGSYETFTLIVPDGEGLDAAAEACASRRLTYIHCSRPKPRPSRSSATREVAP
jgi:hypothetical protein